MATEMRGRRPARLPVTAVVQVLYSVSGDDVLVFSLQDGGTPETRPTEKMQE
ncbi:hypothetical protein ACP4OV_007975 [Aristida adscensionis]